EPVGSRGASGRAISVLAADVHTASLLTLLGDALKFAQMPYLNIQKSALILPRRRNVKLVSYILGAALLVALVGNVIPGRAEAAVSSMWIDQVCAGDGTVSARLT